MGFRGLRASIPVEEFDYQFLMSHLAEYSNPRNKISRMIKDQQIIRVKKGLYVFGSDFRKGLVCKEVLANLIYGPSYISFEYALSFYGMILERVEIITSATTGRTQSFKTAIGSFSYRHIVKSKYHLSVTQKELDPHHRVLMATAEKAIIDQLYISSGVDRSISMEQYFFEDLRVDESSLNQLDISELSEIAEHYSSERIHRAVKFIKRVQSHA
ncbi:MAG: hypothetical protein S4CHLAM81_09260 [Chlamydiales bacterium]|nr:hypothetical protein [Chlamydiales bacterium]MCH9635705.1 hypothetical protein [Chlamydiales bacterium]MCH9704486.1 hypothetical protein [Chlamydiota bacterium]